VQAKKKTVFIADHIREILIHIGEDPDRPGLRDTPARVEKMYREIFRGYDPRQMPKLTKIPNGEDGVEYDSMLADSGYFFSHCEHHMVPFFGQYHFAYIPDKWILGASKIGRTIDYFSARLQVAERLVHQVVDCLEKEIQPKGIILIMKGRHLCKEMRGLKKYNSPYEVSAVRGFFLHNINNCKDEFLARIK
jgi:GTP cyclohydrolase I